MSNRAIECTWALSEFYRYARYISHDDATQSNMEAALRHLHTLKDVFLLGRASNTAKAKANAMRMELVKKGKVDKETNAATCTPSIQRRKMNAWRDYIRYEIDVSRELDADIIFWKIRLVSHWVKQICRCRALQQYSAEKHEEAHKMNLKEGWNLSNHNLNYLPQVLRGCFHFKYLYLVVPLEILLSKYFRTAIDPIVIL